MTYATLAQLQDRNSTRMLIQLTDRESPATGLIDVDVINRVLTDTDAMIDGYVGRRYQLPLVTVPALITDLALAIAIYKLHRKTAPDKVRADYDDAIKALGKISTGMIILDVAGNEPQSSGSDAVRITDKERPFTTDTMKGFI